MLLCLWQPVAADETAPADAPDAASIYASMMKAEARRQFNYDSVVLYRKNKVVAPVRIIQQDGLRRIIALSGSEREVIHKAQGSFRLRTKNFDYRMDAPHAKRPLSQYFNQHLRDLRRHYHIRATGETTVAGVPAWVISVLSLDNLRYSYRFDISKKKHMLLGFVMSDEVSRPIEEVSFADVRFLNNKQGKKPVEMNFPTKNVTQSVGRVGLNTGTPWQFAEENLPAGFLVRREDTRQLHVDGRPILHMIVTDGIAFVSIFIEEEQRDIPHVAHMAGFNTHSTRNHDHQITVVGATPMQTLQLIAQSVRK